MKRYKHEKIPKPPMRKLGTPHMNIIPKLSLPQMLTKVAEEQEQREWDKRHALEWHGDEHIDDDVLLDATDIEIGSAAVKPGTPSTRPSTTQSAGGASARRNMATVNAKSNVLAPVHSARASMAPSSKFEPLGVQGLPSTFGMFGETTPLSARDSVHFRSVELAKKRALHPRLRWPRLACQTVDESKLLVDGGVDGAEGEAAGMIASKALELISAQAIGQPSPVASVDGSRRPKFKAMNRYGLEPREKGPKPRPAILPRADKQQEPAVGSTSTLHAPCVFERNAILRQEIGHSARGSTASASARGSTASVGSHLNPPSVWSGKSASSIEEESANSDDSDSTTAESSSDVHWKKLDRKWFLRMAPISCLPSEPNAKEIRRTIKEDSDMQTERSVSSEVGEYLNFERWGINDDYISALLGAHKKGQGMMGMRHVNLSDNQLSDKGITRLIETGAPADFLTLDLSNNRLRDDGAHAVVQLVGMCRLLRDLNLGGNPLGDDVVEELCNLICRDCRSLEGLGLSQCNIGQKHCAGQAIGQLVSNSNHMKSLDLHWNMLHGEGAVGLFRGVYDNSYTGLHLRRLNLSWNRLGSGPQADGLRRKEATSCAKALASVLREGEVLVHLDLSYNSINAEDCAILAQALNENHTLFGIHLIGNDATVDDFGFIIPLHSRTTNRGGETSVASGGGSGGNGDPNTALMSASPSSNPASAARGTSGAPIAATSSTAAVSTAPGKDRLSSNMQEDEDLQLDRNGLVHNIPGKLRLQHIADFETFGLQTVLHVERNAATLRHNPSLNSLGDVSSSTFSEDDLHMEKKWVQARARVRPIATSAISDLEALQRNAKCCWICENWVEHRVTYTPGVSGDESIVESVSVLFNLDGFTRPTRLNQVEETEKMKGERLSARSLLSGDAKGKNFFLQQSRGGSSRRALQSRKTFCREKVVRWVGVRMLPPSVEPVQILFVVNGRLTVADDYPQKMLAQPKRVSVLPEYVDFMDPANRFKPEDISCVNYIVSEKTAWDKFSRGAATALCVLEDPSKSGGITVLPRQTLKEREVVQHKWKFEASCFKDYPRDNQSVVERCFDKDWSDSRLAQVVRGDKGPSEIAKVLRPNYHALMLAHSCSAFVVHDNEKEPAGINLLGFREICLKYGGEGKGKLIDNTTVKLTDADCMFVAASVIDRKRRAEFPLAPPKALARFQFLEVTVRMALRRFLDRSQLNSGGVPTPGTYEAAISQYSEMAALGADLLQWRREVLSLVFTEQVEMVYRDFISRLIQIYDAYRAFAHWPGRATSKCMSYSAWKMLITDTGLTELTHIDIGMAFALARQVHMDEVTTWRWMEFSFAEFLVGLAFVSFIKHGADVDPDLFDEDLSEFFESTLPEVEHALQERTKSKAKKNKVTDKQIDALIAPAVNMVLKIYAQVLSQSSTPHAAAVDKREFRWAFQSPEVKAEMAKLKMCGAEVDLLIKLVDKDDDGFVSQMELTETIIKMKTLLKGLERAIAFIDKAFVEVDEDGSGTLNSVEFEKLFGQAVVLKKLANLGVSDEDLKELFAVMSYGGSREITMLEVIEGLMFLRDPSQAGVRGVRVLEENFHIADADGSGGLTRAEVIQAFTKQEILSRLQRLELQCPDWDVLFDELDVDKSGDLSWEEIRDGMAGYWGVGSS